MFLNDPYFFLAGGLTVSIDFQSSGFFLSICHWKKAKIHFICLYIDSKKCFAHSRREVPCCGVSSKISCPHFARTQNLFNCRLQSPAILLVPNMLKMGQTSSHNTPPFMFKNSRHSLVTAWRRPGWRGVRPRAARAPAGGGQRAAAPRRTRALRAPGAAHHSPDQSRDTPAGWAAAGDAARCARGGAAVGGARAFSPGEGGGPARRMKNRIDTTRAQTLGAVGCD